jgi:hypothetical protein
MATGKRLAETDLIASNTVSSFSSERRGKGRTIELNRDRRGGDGGADRRDRRDSDREQRYRRDSDRNKDNKDADKEKREVVPKTFEEEKPPVRQTMIN